MMKTKTPKTTTTTTITIKVKVLYLDICRIYQYQYSCQWSIFGFYQIHIDHGFTLRRRKPKPNEIYLFGIKSNNQIIEDKRIYFTRNTCSNRDKGRIFVFFFIVAVHPRCFIFVWFIYWDRVVFIYTVWMFFIKKGWYWTH